ncbi:type II toxin-antitoxin system death-on-curing family toxin [Microbacterium nymphoidis]|uniref:type II toxin-antitoxin system death-on-curing family toxin n=1 Tax=Microbacterium nymphoidis TaxID=2898586 RepID=UPI001E3A1ACF|nr:type II toxin-antitoxin system death-on-curing family toxin [Microbacterium nymphoidis]MCD2498436.1 type II toxin-antitoxin system death-on-curing family toxin [Microbacterium nymphoidis]
MVEYLEPEQAMAVAARFGLHVRDHGLLFSALARPSASMFGEDAYPSIEEKAAALLSSLSQNHALFDGNKRISLILTFVFLELNGYDVVFGDDDAFDLVMAASQSQQDVGALAARIAENIRPRE